MDGAPAVYFLREDYAPLWKRVLVDLIDLFVFAALTLTLPVPLWILLPSNSLMIKLTLLVIAAIAVAYFVILKRSRFRTLGYRLFRVRIVGLDGGPPSYTSLVAGSCLAC